MKTRKYIILENIRSLQNVGAIFRNADGAGFEKIFLCGYTPCPPRREISKTALGAEKRINWEYYKNAKELLRVLKNESIQIYSIELTKDALDYKQLAHEKQKDIALVFGNEVQWISAEVLDISDKTFMIPMLWYKESLNVSVAAGIVMYAMV